MLCAAATVANNVTIILAFCEVRKLGRPGNPGAAPQTRTEEAQQAIIWHDLGNTCGNPALDAIQFTPVGDCLADTYTIARPQRL